MDGGVPDGCWTIGDVWLGAKGAVASVFGGENFRFRELLIPISSNFFKYQ